MNRSTLWRAAWLPLAAFSLQAAVAAEPTNILGYGAEESAIPRTPTAPPSLVQTAPPNPFHCSRQFMYLGKTLDCDSNVRADAERLRPILSDVPSALDELDSYQRGRQHFALSSYLVSLSLLVTISGYLVSRPPFEQNAITTGGYFVLGGAAAAMAGTGYLIGEVQASPSNRSGYLKHLAYFAAVSAGLALLGVAINHPPFQGDFKTGGWIALGGLSMGVGAFGYSLGVQNANEYHLQNAISNFNQAHPDRPIELKISTTF